MTLSKFFAYGQLVFGFGCAWFADRHPQYVWQSLAVGWFVALNAAAWIIHDETRSKADEHET